MAKHITLTESELKELSQLTYDAVQNEDGSFEYETNEWYGTFDLAVDRWEDPYCGNWFEDGPAGYGDTHYDCSLNDYNIWDIETNEPLIVDNYNELYKACECKE